MEIAGLPILQVLLVAAIFLSILIEAKSGGLGAGLLLGILAAGILFGGQYMKGEPVYLQVGLFLGGALAIMLELVLPTLGLLAGIGAAAMLYSLVLALGGGMDAVWILCAAAALAIANFIPLARRLPSSRLWKRIVLREATTAEDGYVSADTHEELIGREGIVLTELRPSGSVLLDGRPIDVVSEGAYIEKGQKVTVVATNGSRVVVRPV